MSYLASVPSGLSSGTDETLVELEGGSQAGFSEAILAHIPRHQGQFDLFEDVLIFASLAELIFSPSGGEAAASVKHLVRPWQAHGVRLGTQIHRRLEEEESDVIEKSRRIVVLVDCGIHDGPVLMREEFVLGLCVPLAHADLETLGVLAHDAMSGRENDGRMDERSSALVVILELSSRCRRRRLEHRDHPREFAVLGFAVLKVGDAHVKAIRIPHSASGDKFGSGPCGPAWRRLDGWRQSGRFAAHLDGSRAIAAH